MRYKLKWRAAGEEPLQPELFDTIEQAKLRARQLNVRKAVVYALAWAAIFLAVAAVFATMG